MVSLFRNHLYIYLNCIFIESSKGLSFILYSHNESFPIFNSLIKINTITAWIFIRGRTFLDKLWPRQIDPIISFFHLTPHKNNSHSYQKQADGTQYLLADQNPILAETKTINSIGKKNQKFAITTQLPLTQGAPMLLRSSDLQNNNNDNNHNSIGDNSKQSKPQHNGYEFRLHDYFSLRSMEAERTLEGNGSRQQNKYYEPKVICFYYSTGFYFFYSYSFLIFYVYYQSVCSFFFSLSLLWSIFQYITICIILVNHNNSILKGIFLFILIAHQHPYPSTFRSQIQFSSVYNKYTYCFIIFIAQLTHDYNLLFTTNMWNLMASNRILDLKWKRQNQRKHINNLKNIKSQINTSAPKQYSFLNSRPKARQLESQRQHDIQILNSLLVNRMLNTTSEIGRNDKIYFKDSLNATFSKKIQKQIDQNNQQLVRRLQSASSQYSQRGMQKYMRKYQKTKTNMASERMDPFYDLESGQQASKTKFEETKRRPFSARH